MIKQTRGAIKFLLAEYRAVLKNAMLAMAVATMTMASSGGAGAKDYSAVELEYTIASGNVLYLDALKVENDSYITFKSGNLEIKDDFEIWSQSSDTNFIIGSGEDKALFSTSGDLNLYNNAHVLKNGTLKAGGSLYVFKGSTLDVSNTDPSSKNYQGRVEVEKNTTITGGLKVGLDDSVNEESYAGKLTTENLNLGYIYTYWSSVTSQSFLELKF